MQESPKIDLEAPGGRRRAVWASRTTPWAATIGVWAICAASHLPLQIAQGLGGWVGRAAMLAPSRARRVAQENVARCLPELDRLQRQRMVRNALVQVATTALEAGAMWRWDARHLAALEGRPVGAELFERARSSGRGVLILAPHVGNWEFLLWYLAHRAPVVALYRPPRCTELHAFVRRSRERFGATLEPASALGLRRFCEALRQGHVGALMPDQVPECGGAVLAPFFDRPALTMTLPQRLLQKSDVIPLFAYALRDTDGRFSVRFVEPQRGLDDADPVRAATQLNRGIESCVRDCPEQYVWTYKRFRGYRTGCEVVRQRVRSVSRA